MAKKNGLTMEQHREIGSTLHAMRDYCEHLSAIMGRAYPSRSPVLRSLSYVRMYLSKLRSELEDAMFKEHPNEGDLHVYYPHNMALNPDTAEDQAPE
jgi:hypothetical protein